MWVPVKGFERLYQVNEKGDVYSTRSGIIIKQSVMASGYKYVHLCNGKTSKSKRVHRLVAEAFIENPNDYKQVNHKNGNKQDNRRENLEWCDAFMNMNHAKEIGLFKTSGEDNPSSKLTWRKVKNIRKKYISGDKRYGLKGLAKKYGVSNVMIGKIINNKCWKET